MGFILLNVKLTGRLVIALPDFGRHVVLQGAYEQRLDSRTYCYRLRPIGPSTAMLLRVVGVLREDMKVVSVLEPYRLPIRDLRGDVGSPYVVYNPFGPCYYLLFLGERTLRCP